MQTLDEIFLECKTDKSSQTHCYAKSYEQYFESIRDKELVILELGVAGGCSIQAWRKYFPNAKVYGIDNNYDCAGEGIFIGSQIDWEFLQKVLDEIGTPDIIIDDASHYGPFTIKSFEILFPKLAKGGWYVVEDAACFYDRTYGEADGNGISEVFNFFSSLAMHVDIRGRAMTGNADYAMKVENPGFCAVPKYSPLLDSMHIHTSIWFLKRRD